jgi:intracellular multiplication protein IcmG
MADEFNDDEYHFSEGDSAGAVFDEETIEPAQTSSLTSKFSGGNLKRNVLIAIGAVIVLLIVYKFLGSLFSSSSKPSERVQAPTQKQVVQKPVIQAPVVQQPLIAQPVQPAVPVLDPAITRKLSRLQDGSEKTQDEIANINDNVDNLKGSLSNIGSQISALNTSIAMLTQEVKQQQVQLLKLKKKPKRYIKHGKEMIPVTKYYVQALIPGRAWLISHRGKTLTVRKGSVIPGYGKVELIDPHQGIVSMSSGHNIMYKVSDT